MIRLRSGLRTAALGLALGAGIRIGIDDADAGHPIHDPQYNNNIHKHVASLNSPTDPELGCVKIKNGSMDFDAARLAVVNSLDSRTAPDPANRHPEWDWEGVAGSHFPVVYGECYIDPYFGRLTVFDYNVDGDVQDECTTTFEPGGCLLGPFNPHYDERSGHTEYDWAEIWFRAGTLTNSPGYIVSHEVGHGLGLCDGGPTLLATVGYENIHPQCDYDPKYDSCTRADGEPSVMHSYGCSLRSWPSQWDRDSVVSLAPGGSVGWNNFSKIW